MNDVSDFQRESYRIDQQIWDALALRAGERALFLGLANEGAWVARAVEIGAEVTVLVAGDAQVARVEELGALAIRGSATMVPATENAYDAAVAMHYLHEIDPGFHRQVVSELARVGRRVAIVEPSPPADALGKRIAVLYARAKRESGQFEGYQTIDYWRKLLAIVKADVWQNLFTFTRVPPRKAVAETVSLVLEAMAIEEMPKAYLDELRELAARPDAQLLPLSRIVLVGTASGVPLAQGSGTQFRPNVALAPPPPAARTRPAVPAAPPPAPVAPLPPPPFGASTPSGFGAWPAEPEMPPPLPPPAPPAQRPPAPPPAAAAAAAAPPAPPPAAAPAGGPPPAGSPAAGPPPFGAPFALPEEPGDVAFAGPPEEPRSGFGWSWEPPEDEPQEPPG
ncbi:MAG TPA: hypothetical protein VFF00_08355 [Candidatus Elarobacter sp.]|nr:hypothetical protein [Candidatus Elarobacter sp.]